MSQERRTDEVHHTSPLPPLWGRCGGRRLSLVPCRDRWDGWEIVGWVTKFSISDRGNYRVRGKIVVEIYGTDRKNRTLLLQIGSKSVYQVAEECMTSRTPAAIRGVMDSCFNGNRPEIRLRVTEIEPWEATDGENLG